MKVSFSRVSSGQGNFLALVSPDPVKSRMITQYCTGLHCRVGCTHPGLTICEWEESALGQPVRPAGAWDANDYNTALQKTSPHLEGLEVSEC